VSEGARERVPGALEQRISVGDEEALGRVVGEPAHRREEVRVVGAFGKPGGRAHSQLSRVDNEDIPGNEGGSLGEPKHRLLRIGHIERLDALRQLHRVLAPPHSAAVAVGNRRGGALVPVDGQEDRDGSREPLDVAIERTPEVLLVTRRDERVDEDHGAGRLVVDAADLLRPVGVGCPVRMGRGEAPESLDDLLDLHGG
jgi:hypothetical protein